MFCESQADYPAFIKNLVARLHALTG